MIDDEADFGDITDAHGEVQTAAKFRPKARRAMSRKPSRSLAPPNPAVGLTDDKVVGALGQDNLSQELNINQETAPSTSFGVKTSGDATVCRDVLDAPSDDVLTVSAVDRVSRNQDHSDDNPSEIATHQEDLVVSDTQASSTYSSGKTIDNLADFAGPFDAHVEEKRAAKFKPEIQVNLSKVVASAVDVVSPNKKDCNNQTSCSDEQPQAPRHQECVQIPDFQASLGTDSSTANNIASLGSIVDEPVQEIAAAKVRAKSSQKPGRASSRVIGTSDKNAEATLEVGVFASDVVCQGRKTDSHGEGHGNDLCQKPTDQESVTVPDALPPQDVDAHADLDSQDELINPHTDDTRSIFGEPSAEPTVKFQPKVGRKKGSSRSVSFVLPDASERVAPTDTNSDMSSISHSCNDMGADENLNNFPQQKAEKHCSTEELSSDLEYTDKEGQYHEGEPSDHAAEQQPKLDVGKLQLSMKLRNRKKSQKTGISAHTAADNFDEDSVELSAAEQENDSGDEYPNPAGGKQKGRKQRKKEKNKKPLRGSESTSIEESQQQNLQKNKSEVSSRGRKRALKDTSTGQHEKKLTHRIRQKRTKEIKTLLEKPDHEIDRMKLSVMHLRLLQEAREHTKSKTIPSGQSSNQSSQFGDTDNFDLFGENYDNDRPENHVQENATKLNYHSYMNKQTRAKWSKSDTDLFYQGLQQFGSDFAMIQQLFPDKTRDQVRRKFKTEEKKNPMQVHDAILHRSRDNLHLKQVIKQLNIEDVQRDTNNTHEQDGASHEGNPGNEKALDGSINEEESDSNWSDKEQGTQRSEVTEGEHDVSANADDGLDVFDWY